MGSPIVSTLFSIWTVLVLHVTFNKVSVTQLFIWLAWLLVATVLAQGTARLITPELMRQAQSMYGDGIAEKLKNWGGMVESSTHLSDSQKLAQVNQYFNDELAFISDQQHWQQEDYWATPLESLGTEAGDCEDYVIAKYFSLVQAGVDENKLRITYVKALKLNQAHMVLAYYARPKSDPLILDNLTDKILPASKRRDLSPVYSFNGMGMWLERMKGGSIRVGDPNRLNMWMDLLLRMEEYQMAPWVEPVQR